MSFLSILTTSPMLSMHPAPQVSDARLAKVEDTAGKEPQPISSGPPPFQVDNFRRLSAAATRASDDNRPPEAAEQILDEETQSALVSANSVERLDMPRMSAALASAMITLNAKPTSLAHLLAGSEDGPSLMERAYSQLGETAGPDSADRVPYNKTA